MKSPIALNVVRYFLVAVIIIVFLFPLFFIFNTSLKTEYDFIKSPISIVTNIHLANYIDAYTKAKLDLYALNSVFFVAVVVAVSLLLSLFLAFPLARRFFKSTSFIYTAFIAGMFLPSGTIPMWQMFLRAGLYDTRLGYMLTMISGGGITLFLFVSYIKYLPKDFDEAASIDGCGYIRYILTIIVPLMKPAISSMAILSAIGVWNEVINSIIYLSTDRLFPVTRGLYVFRGQYSVQWTLFTSALVIVAAPMVILYIFLQRFIIDSVITGGLKF
ncbi:MAG: carbohydrate ABC transporter permease [Ruminiclostridium sp.]|nr:carbohydrate ABC transporter permease [Ruminiclostridium sp.]